MRKPVSPPQRLTVKKARTEPRYEQAVLELPLPPPPPPRRRDEPDQADRGVWTLDIF